VNRLERWGLKLAYRRMEAKMPLLKKWGPLVGSFLVLSTVVLRALGYGGPADAIDSVARAVGLFDASVVDHVILTGAIGGLAGQFLKVKSEITKARAPKA